MINVPLNIILHENQKIIHKYDCLYKVAKCGKRFGKTKLAIFALVQAAGKKVGLYWYIGPTFKHAKNIAWSELKWILPRQLIKRSVENELTIELINGSVIKLIGAENEDALRGTKVHGVVFDEAAYTDSYAWEGIVSGQLLGNEGEGKGFAWFISSPNKRGRNWYSNFWEDAKSKMDSGDKEWGAFYFTIYDNPTLNREDIEKLRQNTTDDTWELEYMARESSHAGQIYSEFSYSNHVRVSDIGGVVVRGLDWGISHPTACIWARVDVNGGRVHIFNEFMRSNLVIEESCKAITNMVSGPIEWSVIDPSTSKRNSQTNRRDLDEFNRHGVLVIPGDNRDRGYDITKMFFKKNIITIDPKCKNLILQLKNLQYGDKDNDDMCFIEGTKILTSDGEKKIEEVFIGDRVLTRDGYKRVISSGMTNANADVYKIVTTAGEIVGTYGHPIMTKDGWVALGKLTAGQKLFDSRFYYLIQYGTWILRLFLLPYKSLTEYVTTSWAGGIFKDVIMGGGERLFSTGKSGNIITGKFLKNIKFIIRTRTEGTTKFPIFNYCIEGNTCDTTCVIQTEERSRDKICLLSFIKQPLSGTVVKRGASSTGGFQERVGSKKSGLRKTVQFAVDFTRHLFLLVQNFVILIAGKLTFKDVRVISAEHLPTKQAVYNLTIEDSPEYFANGLLVHNCDSLRYLCVRIHDTMFNRILNFEQPEIESPFKRRPYNVNDPFMFPKNQSNGSSILQEIGRY